VLWHWAQALLRDKGYHATWLRAALTGSGITPCNPSRANRTFAIAYDRELYRQRRDIENMFSKLKDWRRIHIRYDRCAKTSCQPSASRPPSSSESDK
jgi:transposase